MKRKRRYWIARPTPFFSLSAVACVVLFPFVTLGASTSVAVSGQITTDKGTPLPNVVVSIHQHPGQKPVANAIKYDLLPDAGGNFSVNVADIGNYVVCVTPLGSEYLDPCQWPNPSPSATFTTQNAPNAAVKGLKLALQPGTTLHFRVDDPGALLPTPSNPQKSAFFDIGVWCGGRYYAAHIVSVTNNGLDYELLVPKDTDLSLSIRAIGVKVIDDSGVLLVDGGTITSNSVDTALFHSPATGVAALRSFRVR